MKANKDTVTMAEKLNSLSYCINGGYSEDVLYHLGDLFRHFVEDFNKAMLEDNLPTMTIEKAFTRFIADSGYFRIEGPSVLDVIANRSSQKGHLVSNTAATPSVLEITFNYPRNNSDDR